MHRGHPVDGDEIGSGRPCCARLIHGGTPWGRRSSCRSRTRCPVGKRHWRRHRFHACTTMGLTSVAPCAQLGWHSTELSVPVPCAPSDSPCAPRHVLHDAGVVAVVLERFGASHRRAGPGHSTCRSHRSWRPAPRDPRTRLAPCARTATRLAATAMCESSADASSVGEDSAIACVGPLCRCRVGEAHRRCAPRAVRPSGPASS